jgi:hypothetical protein
MKLLIFAALYLLSLGANGQINSWPAPYAPAGAQIEDVGDVLVVNGMPMKIVRWRSALTTADILKDFQNTLKKSTLNVSRSANGIVIATGAVGQFLTSIELQQTGSIVQGRWSVSQIARFDAAKARSRKHGAVPDTSKIVHQVESYDHGKRSHLLVGTDTAPISQVALHIEAKMNELGFKKNTYVKTSWPAVDRYIAVFEAGREEIRVTLSVSDKLTWLVFNSVSAMEVLQ